MQSPAMTLLSHFRVTLFSVKRRVEGVEVLTVKIVLNGFQRLTETLEMDNFALAQELDRVTHIRIVNKTDEVVVSSSCLLFCCNRERTT